MTQISAAENLLIDFTPEHWRLIQIDSDGNPSRLLVEALPQQSFRYAAPFARSRRLPQDGALPVEYIREVVLGWSTQDEAWHLGFLLGRDMAEARGSRWCEIVHWPDPDQTVFASMALEAGQALARTVNRPFDLIRPRSAPVAPPPELPALPLTAGLWTLNPATTEQGTPALAFERHRRWMLGRALRALWYLFLAVIYVLLSLATLQTDLALPNAGTMLPNPELLPYLGLGVALLLVGMVIYIVFEMLSKPDRIVIDPNQRSVTAYRGRRAQWTLPAQELQAVYVTQVVNRRGKKRSIYHSEMNFLLADGSFQQAFEHVEQEELPGETSGPAQEGVTPLDRFTMRGHLHAAGLYVAEALGGLPCWYDQRTR